MRTGRSTGTLTMRSGKRDTCRQRNPEVVKMNVAEAFKQCRLARERRQSLTDRSSAVARAHQKARRELEATIVATGVLRFVVSDILPLPTDAEVVDTQAREQARGLLRELLSDEKIRGIEVRYTRDTPDKADKRLGMPYRVSAKAHNVDSVKGTKTPEEQEAQNFRNGTLQVWCCDSGRKDWRSIKVGAVSAVQVKGADSVYHWIPVEYVTPDGNPVALNWRDKPVRATVSTPKVAVTGAIV